MPPLAVGASRLGPRPLKRMCLAVAMRNLAQIQDLGDLSFADARPLLLHIDDPQHLHDLEQACPQLRAEPAAMASVWRKLLARRVPDWHARDYLGTLGYAPDAHGNVPWLEVWELIKAAQDAQEAAATARLQATLAGWTEAKKTNATQLATGWQASRVLNKKLPGVGIRKRGASSYSSSSPSYRIAPTTPGQNVLRRARREAQTISRVTQLGRPGGVAVPLERNQIRAPPPAMVHDHRVAQQREGVTAGAVVIRAPRRPGSLSGSGSGSGHNGRSRSPVGAGLGLGAGNPEWEARLLALKRGVAVAKEEQKGKEKRPRDDNRKPTHDDDNDNDNDNDNDLFGDEDDNLFGEREERHHSPKRRRLDVADIERPATRSSSSSTGPSPPKRPLVAVRAKEAREAREATPAKPPARPPAKPTMAKPPADAPARRTPALGPGPPRKKTVDIFMKKKKR